MSEQGLYKLPNASGDERGRVLLFGLLALLFAVFAGLAGAASALAAALSYPSRLGAPLLTPSPSHTIRALALLPLAGGVLAAVVLKRWRLLPTLLSVFIGSLYLSIYPLYPPAAFFLAHRALSGTVFQPAILTSYRAGALFFLLALVASTPILERLFRLTNNLGHLHGSARFATTRDIEAAGFLLDEISSTLSQSPGLPLGLIRARGGDRLLRLGGGENHVLLVAPPGGGKSSSFVIPVLQDYPHNVVALDVKGELATATAGHRHAMGSQILLWDPSRNEPHLARYNPLLSIRPYPFDVQDVQQLAQLLIPDPPNSSEPFWRESARTLLEGLILFILYTAPRKTLAACYRALADPERPIEEVLEAMLTTTHDPRAKNGWTHHERITTAARALLDMPAQTRGGVVAQAQASLSPYADPILAEASSTSDFALSDLFLARERPITLYLLLDPNNLSRLSNHVRIVVSQITSALTRQIPSQVSRRQVLLILDEFASLGSMQVVEKALAYLRGYWVQAFLVIQHFGQLTQAYGPSESISPNCAVHIAFAPSHLETAQKLSARAGNQTVVFKRDSVSLSAFSGRRSVQSADTGRPLLTPDEILRLPKGKALILRASTRPIITSPQPYFADPARSRAAQLPVPVSEPTCPDFSCWLDRPVAELPIRGKRERRVERRSLLEPDRLV